MKFCPECSNMLTYVLKDRVLFDFCESCNYDNESTETIVHREIHREDAYDDPNAREHMIYSEAVQRTVHQKCPNKECPGRKDPEAIIMNKVNSMEQLYICVHCNVEWSNN